MKKQLICCLLMSGLLIIGGCATQNSTIPASTGIGAAAGALLGYGLTGTGHGAAAGAGAGALAGALTGLAIDQTRKQTVAPPPQSTSNYPKSAYAHQSDPTRGEFVNKTNWRLEVWIDKNENPLFLGPGEVCPINLDIGSHQITSRAYVQTRFGERLVGTHHQNIYIYPQSTGWSLVFDRNLF